MIQLAEISETHAFYLRNPETKRWVNISERNTHTGRHISVNEVDSLALATPVGYTRIGYITQNIIKTTLGIDPATLERVKVRVTTEYVVEE